MSSRRLAGIAKYGFGTLGVALALVAMGGASAAQPAPATQPAPAAPSAPATQPAPAAAAAPSAAGDAAIIDKGRDIFSNYGCANCHTLNDAGATGHVGPALDGNTGLTKDFIVSRVTDGQGMMPPFAGQLTPEEINTVAAYIMKVATK